MPKATHAPTTHRIIARRQAVAPVGGVTDRRTHRRRFLVEASVAVAASLGVTAALLAPDPTWGAPATDGDGPDAALIAACTAFDALHMQECALYRTAHTMADEDRIEPEIDALHDRQAPLVTAICSLRATTDAGHIARARSFALLSGILPDIATQEDTCWDKRMVAAMGRDLAPELGA